jgi:predicted  nucleic acid-binding Zn-ribbon protein
MQEQQKRISMSQFPVHLFIELVNFDQALYSKEKEIEKVQQEIAAAKKELQACQISLENSKKHRADMRKEVDARELEMKSFDEKEKGAKQRLDGATNTREYDSAKTEIDSLHQKRQELEQQLLATWKKFETAEVELEQKKKFCDEQMKAKDSIIEDKMKQEAALRNALEEQQKIRKEKEKGVPEEWRDKYAAMRTKVQNPVVPIDHDSCTACFYKVSQKDIIELRKGKLLVCRDCFRFLFDPTALERAAEHVENP